MEEQYTKGLGVYVGTFTPEQYRAGEVRKALDSKIAEHNNKYIYTKFIERKKNGKVSLDYYICNAEDAFNDWDIDKDAKRFARDLR